MKFLRDLPYDIMVPIDENMIFEGLTQKIFLVKTFCPGEKRDVYHLKSFLISNDGEVINQGYIYFYLSFSTKQSKFCGIFINPEYRNKGLASLLVSSWIRLCLDNGILTLDTIKKQRKPFLIYLLKTYSFELRNIDLYRTDRKLVTICKSDEDSLKYLLFKDRDFREEFSRTAIMAHDNYNIIENLDSYKELDNILLSRRYDLQDRDKAYSKASLVYKRYQR